MHNFENEKLSGFSYGGSEDKDGIVYKNSYWILKYPNSTANLKGNIGLSYTSASLSEYIGSQIYKLLGFSVHETELGIKKGKVVVACKDFKSPSDQFCDFHSLKNHPYEQSTIPKNSSLSSYNTEIEKIIEIFKRSDIFYKFPELKKRFYDMFVVDALINNNDRNEGNWGIIVNYYYPNHPRLAPVFDNGGSFYSKMSDDKMFQKLSDDKIFTSVVYNDARCAFSKDGKILNPLKYIESMENKDLNKALKRIVPHINMKSIKKMINDIPSEYEGVEVMSDIRKDFYIKSMEYKYEKVLLPTYNKLLVEEVGGTGGVETGDISSNDISSEMQEKTDFSSEKDDFLNNDEIKNACELQSDENESEFISAEYIETHVQDKSDDMEIDL